MRALVRVGNRFVNLEEVVWAEVAMGTQQPTPAALTLFLTDGHHLSFIGKDAESLLQEMDYHSRVVRHRAHGPDADAPADAPRAAAPEKPTP